MPDGPTKNRAEGESLKFLDNYVRMPSGTVEVGANWRKK